MISGLPGPPLRSWRARSGRREVALVPQRTNDPTWSAEGPLTQEACRLFRMLLQKCHSAWPRAHGGSGVLADVLINQERVRRAVIDVRLEAPTKSLHRLHGGGNGGHDSRIDRAIQGENRRFDVRQLRLRRRDAIEHNRRVQLRDLRGTYSKADAFRRRRTRCSRSCRWFAVASTRIPAPPYTDASSRRRKFAHWREPRHQEIRTIEMAAIRPQPGVHVRQQYHESSRAS